MSYSSATPASLLELHMPIRAPRICSCGQRVAYGEKCACQVMRQRKQNKLNDARRGSAAARGYDAEWQRLSRAYLAEPGNRYCACGAPAVLVGHIVAIKFAPQRRLDRSNWKPSCQACNLRQNIRCEGGFGRQRKERQS